MSYQLLFRGMVRRVVDGVFIPPDPSNTDYAEYLKWVAEGNTPDVAPPLPFQGNPTT